MKRSWKRILAGFMAACIIFGDSSLVYAAESTQPVVESSETEVIDETLDEEIIEEVVEQETLEEETVAEEETEVEESEEQDSLDNEMNVVEPSEESVNATTTNSEAPETSVEEPEIIQISAHQEVFVNPLYKDVVSEEDILNSVSAVMPADELDIYTNDTDIVKMVREGLVARNASITFAYEYEGTYDEEYVMGLVASYMDDAMEHTGNPKEGDYIKWNYAGDTRGISSGYSQGDKVHVELFYSILYYTSAEMEAEMDEAVDSLLNSLQLSDLAEYEQIRGIYDYICENVVYDNANLKDEEYKLKYTPYAALINKTAVCQGYATLFYRMALETGLDARVITGDAGGAHAWNIVELDNQYYNLDSTWDAGKSTYSYFLKNMDGFTNHVRDEEYLSESFMAAYPMSKTTYGEQAEAYTGTVEGECLYIRHWEVENNGGTFDDATILSALQSWDRTFDQIMICYPENYSTTIPADIWNAVKELQNSVDSSNGFLFDGGMEMNIDWFIANMETATAPVKLDASMTIVGLGMCYGDVTVSGAKDIPAGGAHIRFNTSKWKDDGGEVEKNDYQTIVDTFGQSNKEFDLYLNDQVIAERSDRYEWYKSEDGDHYSINADICLFNVEELGDGTYQMVYKNTPSSNLNWVTVGEELSTGILVDVSEAFVEEYYFQPEEDGFYGFKGIEGWSAYKGTVTDDEWSSIERASEYYKVGDDQRTVEFYYEMDSDYVYKIRVHQWLEEGESIDFTFVKDTTGDTAEEVTLNGEAITLSNSEMKIVKFEVTKPTMFVAYSTSSIEIDILCGTYAYRSDSDRAAILLREAGTYYFSLLEEGFAENTEVRFVSPESVELSLGERCQMEADGTAIAEMYLESGNTYYIKIQSDLREYIIFDAVEGADFEYEEEYFWDDETETEWLKITAQENTGKFCVVAYSLNGDQEIYFTDQAGYEAGDTEQKPEEIDYNLVVDKTVTIPASEEESYFEGTFYFTPEESGNYYIETNGLAIDWIDPDVEFHYANKKDASYVGDYLRYMKLEAGINYEIVIDGEIYANTPDTLTMRRYTGEEATKIAIGEEVTIPADSVAMFVVDGNTVSEGIFTFSGDIEIIGAAGNAVVNGKCVTVFDIGANFIQVKAGPDGDAKLSFSALNKNAIEVGEKVTLANNAIECFELKGEYSRRYIVDSQANQSFIVYKEDGDIDCEKCNDYLSEEVDYSEYYDSIYVITVTDENGGSIYFGPGNGRMDTVSLELNKAYSSGINTMVWREYTDRYVYTPEKSGYYYFEGDVDYTRVWDMDGEYVEPAYYSLNNAGRRVCHYYLEKDVWYEFAVDVYVEAGVEAVYQFVEDTVGDTSTEIFVDGDAVAMTSGETKVFRFKLTKPEFVEFSATGEFDVDWYNVREDWGKTAFFGAAGTYYVFVTANDNLSVELNTVTKETITLDTEITIPEAQNMLYEMVVEPGKAYYVRMDYPQELLGVTSVGEVGGLAVDEIYDAEGNCWSRIQPPSDVEKIWIFAYKDYLNKYSLLVSENYAFEKTITSWSGTVTVPAGDSVTIQYQGDVYGDYFVEEPYSGVFGSDVYFRNLYAGSGVHYKFRSAEQLNGLSCKGYQLNSISIDGDNPEKIEFAFTIDNYSTEDMTFTLKTNEDFESKVFNEGDAIRWRNDYWWWNGECNFQYYTITPTTTKVYHLSETDWIYRASDRKVLSNRTLLEAGETYYVRVYGLAGINAFDITEVSGTETKFEVGTRLQRFIPTVSGDYSIDAESELKLWNAEKSRFEEISSNEKLSLTAETAYILWSFGDGRIGLNRNVTILDYDYYQVFTSTASGGSVTLNNGKLEITKNEQDGFTLKDAILSLFGVGSYKEQPKKDYMSANQYWTSDAGSFSPTEYYLLNEDGSLTECGDRVVTAGDVLVVKYEPEYVWVDRFEVEVGETILTAGESTTLKVTPYAATDKYGFKSEPEVRIMTSDPEVANILPDGTIETYKAGTVDITVYADETLKRELGLEDTIVSEKVTITVEPKSEDIVLEYTGTVEQEEDGEKLYIRAWEMSAAGVPFTDENVLSILNKRINDGDSFAQVFICYSNNPGVVDKDVWNAVKELMDNAEWSAGFLFSNGNSKDDNWFVAGMQTAEEDVVLGTTLTLGTAGECGSIGFGNTNIPAESVHIRLNTAHWNDGATEGGRDDYEQFIAAFGTESCELDLIKDGTVLEDASVRYEYYSESQGNVNLNLCVDHVNRLEANVTYELAKKNGSGEEEVVIPAPSMELAKDSEGNVIGVKVTNQTDSSNRICLEWYCEENDSHMYAWEEFVSSGVSRIVLFSEMNLWGYESYPTLTCYVKDYETDNVSEKASLDFAIEAVTNEYLGEGITLGHGNTSDNAYQYYYISEEQIPDGAGVSYIRFETQDSDVTTVYNQSKGMDGLKWYGEFENSDEISFLEVVYTVVTVKENGIKAESYVIPESKIKIEESIPNLTFKYEILDDNSVKITGFVGSIGNKLVIPEKIGNYEVSAIGFAAFMECTGITELVIPESVDIIENAAFRQCTNLEKVTLPTEMESIGSFAFGACDALKELVLPNGIKVLQNSVFWECDSLTSIVIPNGVEKIELCAFSNCDNLKEIIVPEGVKKIAELGIVNCPNLRFIQLPESIESIGNYTFCQGDLDIGPETFENMDVVIGCKKDSYVHTWAVKNGFEVVHGGYHKITFDVAGGTINSGLIEGYIGDFGAVLPKDVTKDNYVFGGWYDNAEFQGDNVTEIPAGSSGDKEFYAKWEIKEYTIDYDLAGGTNSEKNVTKYTVEDTVIFYEPTRPGYEFLGWFNEENEKITGLSNSAENLKLTAKWSLNKYNIKFVSYDGTILGDIPETYTYESNEIVLPTIKKDGYEFKGWFTNQLFVGEAVNSIPKGSTGDKTFYAKWDVKTYTITYVLNNGTEIKDNPTTYTIESDAITLNPSTRKGYTFAGWYTDASFDESSKVSEIPAGSMGNKTFYAKWTKDTYTINYQLDGGTNAPENPANYSVDSATITLAHPTRDGYTFGGWYNNPEFNGSSIDKLQTGTSGDQYFYAKWNPIEYTITFEENGGTINGTKPEKYSAADEAFVLPTDVTKDNYKFIGWFETENCEGQAVTEIPVGSVGHKVFYAGWTVEEFTITYNVNGGELADGMVYGYSTESATIELKEPTRKGYTFAGWYTNEAFDEKDKVIEIPTGSSGNKEFFAKWDIDKYSIAYKNVNSEDLAEETVYSYTIEDGTINLLPAVRKGYKFHGWYVNPRFTGTPITEFEASDITNKVFYAKLTRDTYTITYYLYGGKNATGNPGTYHVESMPITLKNPTRAGYTFDKWIQWRTPEEAIEVSTIQTGSTGNYHLHAYWTPIPYDITYVLNDGTTKKDSYTIETEILELPTPVREGYTFDGWYTNAKFGAKYKVTEIPLGSMGNKTFYAKWILDTYEITYENLEDATFEIAPPTSYNIETGATLENPTRLGYEFLGWYETEEVKEGDAPVAGILAGITGNKTFYARWDWDVEFEASINESSVDLRWDEGDDIPTIILPYDEDAGCYDNVDVNISLVAKQNGSPIGIHIPADDIKIEIYQDGYDEDADPYDESTGYDFQITESEADGLDYTAVVKFNYGEEDDNLQDPSFTFRVELGKQPLPINSEITWEGISNVDTGLTFESIKEELLEKLFEDKAVEEGYEWIREAYAGTITFKNVKNQNSALKSGTYTIVYALNDEYENDLYFTTAEATVEIKYNKFSVAGVKYEVLEGREYEVLEEGRIEDAGAVAYAVPVEAENGETQYLNTTPYVTGVKITPMFNVPWSDSPIDADEMENAGYQVAVSWTPEEDTVLDIKPASLDDQTDDEKPNAVSVTAKADPKTTVNKTIKLTSTVSLKPVDGEEQGKPATLVTTIKNFKVYNGGSSAIQNLTWFFDGVDKTCKESYLFEKDTTDKQVLPLIINATDYAGNDITSMKNKLTWSTSNKAIAAISVDKTTGQPTITIPKNAQGVAVIKAVANDAGKATFSFRIVIADLDVRVENTKLTLNSKTEEAGIVNIYPNILAQNLFAGDNEDKFNVSVVQVNKNGELLAEDAQIFATDDRRVIENGDLSIKFREAQNSKKNYTVYLQVTQHIPGKETDVISNPIKVTITDKCSLPGLSGKASVNYNTALGDAYGYAEVLVTTGAEFENVDTDLKLKDTDEAPSPFMIAEDGIEEVGMTKSGMQYRVKLVFKDGDTKEEYTPAPKRTKKVNVQFVANYAGYRQNVESKNIAITMTNVRPDFKLSSGEMKNPMFYKDKDMNLRLMKVYIDVPENMVLKEEHINLTDKAAGYFEIVKNSLNKENATQYSILVRSTTTGNGTIQFNIENSDYYAGETLSKGLKSSGRAVTAESITLYDQNTNQKAKNSFTFYQSLLGKESIELYADSQYLAQILPVNNGTSEIEVQAANTAATKLLNAKALIVEKSEDGTSVRMTATQDAFDPNMKKITSCKLKVFLNVTDSEGVTKATKSQTITITFNPKTYDPAVTLKASSSLNVADIEAAVTVTPTFKYVPAGAVVESVVLKNVADAQNFMITEGSESVNGTFTLGVVQGAQIPSGKNTIAVTYAIRTVSGELLKVDTSVVVNVTQSAKIAQSAKTMTLYNSVIGDDYAKEITFTETKVDAPISVTILNEEELNNAGISVEQEDAITTFSGDTLPTEEVKYKVYVDEDLNRGQEKTYTVKAKVELLNSATKKGEPITYNVSFKVKLAK